jgi:hypothetical protein
LAALDAEVEVEQLRPIVYGLSRIAPGGAPDLVASVHSATGQHLGFVVVDRARPGASWGALLVASDLSIDDACLLARATTLQLGLFSVPRGSCHFLFTGGDGPRRVHRAERRAFLEALRPLTHQELCRVVLEDGATGLRPPIARRGLIASAIAATTTALDYSGRSVRGSTLALHCRTPVAREIAAALVDQGLRLLADGDDRLAAEADVVLVGAPFWTLEASDASIVRARVLVALGATRSSLVAEEALHERGVLFVPDAVAAGGRLLALHLMEGGAAEKEALVQTAGVASERLAEILGRFPDRPLPDAVRAHAAGGEAAE